MLRKLQLFDVLQETLTRLDGDGILLLAGDPPNPMTIGWGTIGPIWSKWIMTVLVRPTRHTFSLMEKAEDFSVCILPDGYQKDLHLCGTKSGRDLDKVEACSFKTKPGHTIKTRYLEVSSHHFECRIVHKHWLDHETLDPAIIKRYYPKRDFHMVYYGEILGIYGK